ncbi:DUF5047 domain-containing protein [Streptomyces sp. NPDC057638]|uniref:DUF5047 domain-containing protein n=1 Tax=Streptomyces sp. NPDC057638 TaxID=3346190 RepID=UPI00368160F2
MRRVSAQWASTITTTHTIVTDVVSYLGESERLATVPITAGQIVYDATARGQRRCQITVPLIDGGTRWDPGSDPRHPLASYGQRLRIRTGVRHPDGTAELLEHGQYLVNEVTVDETEGTVNVTGADLYALMEQCRITENTLSFLPTGDSYLLSTLRLTYARLNVDDTRILNAGWTDEVDDRRTLSAPVETPEGADRTPILDSLCAAWPAQMYVRDDGLLVFDQAITGPAATPVARIQAGTTGTLVTRGRRAARQRVYNAVYATGINPDTGAVRARGSAVKTTGPLNVRGPYGWVSRWYTSPFLTTTAQANATARTLLARGTLYARTEEITAAPDPALQLNDTVDVVSPGGGTFRGLISSITLPLTAAGGPMALSVTNDTPE